MAHLYNGLRLGEDEAFFHYTNGLDGDGVRVGKDIFLSRGEAMGELLEAWLSLW